MMQEHHEERFKEGELDLVAKEAFFEGLRPEYRPMIAHLMGKRECKTLDLLAKIRKEEETEERHRGDRRSYHYSSRSRHSSKDREPDQKSGYRYPWDGHSDHRRRDGLAMRVAQIEEDEEDDEDEDPMFTKEDCDMVFKDAYYVGVARIADEDDWRTGWCFNCKEEGHQWRRCPGKLREDLCRVLEQQGIDDKRLNKSGDGGTKGGRNSRREQGERTPEPATPPQ